MALSFKFNPFTGNFDTVSLVSIGSPANGLSVDSNQVLSIQLADATHTGALSDTDWNTFNNKVDVGNYVTDPTAVVSGQGAFEKNSGGTPTFILGYADGTKFSAFDGLGTDLALFMNNQVALPTAIMTFPPATGDTANPSGDCSLSSGTIINAGSAQASGAANIYTGGNYGTGASGGVNVQSGDILNSGSAATTGTANIRSGANPGTGNTGLAALSSGNQTNGTSGNSGLVRIRSGTVAGSGTSGTANVISGNATASTGSSGNVNITSGNSVGGNSGNINLTTGTAGATRGNVVMSAASVSITTSLALVNFNTSELRNVVDPTLAQSAATKNYVDTNFTAKTAGDIALTSFSAVNNQSSAADVTGLLFSTGSIRSFEALVSVSVVATSSLFEVFTLRGVYNGTSWNMAQTSNGDASLFVFTITNAGQVQYTDANYSGFTSATVKFRAIVTTQ